MSNDVQFLSTTRIGEKGQLTVPKEYREDLGLEAGAPFAVLRIGDGLILMPAQRHFEELCGRIARVFADAHVSADEVLSGLPAARERVYQRLYGKTVAASKKKVGRPRKAK
jgi:AbrB family looped-hinge helix DNA binding protein